jgi:hypothetical protein
MNDRLRKFCQNGFRNCCWARGHESILAHDLSMHRAQEFLHKNCTDDPAQFKQGRRNDLLFNERRTHEKNTEHSELFSAVYANPKGNFSSEKFPESSPDVGTTHPVSGYDHPPCFVLSRAPLRISVVSTAFHPSPDFSEENCLNWVITNPSLTTQQPLTTRPYL